MYECRHYYRDYLVKETVEVDMQNTTCAFLEKDILAMSVT